MTTADAVQPQIDQIHNSDALLNVVRQLRPVSFRYKDNSESKHSRYGFVAQELETLLPAVVQADKVSGLRYVRYTDVLAVLVLGAQYSDALATTINSELSNLEERLVEDAVLVDPRLAALERALVDIVAAGATLQTISPMNILETTDINGAFNVSASSSNIAMSTTGH